MTRLIVIIIIYYTSSFSELEIIFTQRLRDNNRIFHERIESISKRVTELLLLYAAPMTFIAL